MKVGEFRKSKRKRKGKKKRKKKKEEGEVQKKEMVENVQREDCKPLHDEDERGKEGKRRQREKRTSQSETSLGEVWKRTLSPFALGAELAMCQHCSGRTAEKDGNDGKDAAAGSSGKKEQMVDSSGPAKKEKTAQK